MAKATGSPKTNTQFSEWDTGRRIAAGMHTTMTPRSAVKKPAAKL